MTSLVLERLASTHAAHAREGLLRQLRVVECIDGNRIRIAGRALRNFASNDYLGLAQHPLLREALVRAAVEWGVGAGAAHLLGGHREEHARLEEKIARWLRRDRALLFSTGYVANLGVLQTLLGANDVCVEDKLNHASLIDAARLAGCGMRRYVHADACSARRQLDATGETPALLATDGVFSMDGDVAPLRELATLCEARRSALMVDDAHGIGVLGIDGEGSVGESGLSQRDVPIVMATLGKALGVAGAFVAGSATLIEGLVQFARGYIYTTAMPPALAAATSVAIDVARNETWRRAKLARLVRHFREGASERGIEILPSRTPIQPVLIGTSADAVNAAARLEAAGFFVPAIRSPTVSKGKARLRVTLCASHEEGDVEQLLNALAHAVAATRTRGNAID
ncbi:MAG: 8-amino-7-oxononanoate synthase [Rudaea sp.]